MQFKRVCKRITHRGAVSSIKGFDLIVDPKTYDCDRIDDELPKEVHPYRNKLILIELDKERMVPRYVYYLLQHLKNRGVLENAAKDRSVIHTFLNAESLGSIDCFEDPLPPSEIVTGMHYQGSIVI